MSMPCRQWKQEHNGGKSIVYTGKERYNKVRINSVLPGAVDMRWVYEYKRRER